MSPHLSLQHIQKIGFVARYITLVSLVLVPVLHIVLFLSNEFVLVNSSSPIWFELIEHYKNEGKLWVMALAAVPLIAIHMFFMFWFSRLFLHYARGKLLDAETVHCYIWLAWLYAVAQILKLLAPFVLLIWSRLLFGESQFTAVVQPINLLFAPVLLIIAYSLKLACEIQQENREFV